MEEIKQIADHYGPMHQLRKAKEELEECSDAIDDVLHGNMLDTDTLDHLAEEIADARIMLDQLEYLLDLKSQTTYWRAFKLLRQTCRIRGDDGGIV